MLFYFLLQLYKLIVSQLLSNIIVASILVETYGHVQFFFRWYKTWIVMFGHNNVLSVLASLSASHADCYP